MYTQVSGNGGHPNKDEDIVSSIWWHIAVYKRYKRNELIWRLIIVEVEKSHAITAKGPSGVNLDESYTEEKRSFDDTMTGLMSISTSPDANCGVVRALTVDPKITSPRGFIDTTKDVEKMNDANLFSMAEMLTPLGVTRDDSIRTAMATKQSKMFAPL